MHVSRIFGVSANLNFCLFIFPLGSLRILDDRSEVFKLRSQQAPVEDDSLAESLIPLRALWCAVCVHPCIWTHTQTKTGQTFRSKLALLLYFWRGIGDMSWPLCFCHSIYWAVRSSFSQNKLHVGAEVLKFVISMDSWGVSKMVICAVKWPYKLWPVMNLCMFSSRLLTGMNWRRLSP